MGYGYFSPLIGLPEEDSPMMGLSENSSEDSSMMGLSENSSEDSLSTGNSPMMGLTENSSATYLSSGNACLDFFFHVVPDTPPSQLVDRLEAAWAHDPLTALKLICNLRGVRGTGKTDKEGFYTAALWLFKNHPKTLACNVLVYASFGYFKDLLEIMFRILEGPEARTVMKSEWESVKSASKLRGLKRKSYHVTKTGKKRTDTRTQAKKKRRLRAEVPKEERIEANKAKVLEEKQRAKDLKREKALERSMKAMDMYNTNMDYQLLFENVSTLFADLLKADIQFVNSGEAKNISLAGKWCPTIDSSYDKYLLIYASIAKKVFPRESYPEYEGIAEDKYVYLVRNRLRKEVLVPLHEVLKLPEVYMSAQEWSLIAYNRVASVAMKTYTKIFMDHDKERFSEYLMNVKQGKAKIAAGALLPHEIIRSACMERYFDSDSDSEGEKTVAELQWKRMVDDMTEKGKLTNCIAVCDVSASMSGTPMEVSVALGILVSELSEEPWKGQVITFSEEPQLHIINGDSLQEKYSFVRHMQWGMNTNFQKVFDRILEVAVTSQLSQEQMIKTVFVFSDMEFDQASLNPWETDYKVITNKFRKRGYIVPEIVFWNLRSSSATPVKATQNGVALLSGSSKNFLTMFLDGRCETTPAIVMEAAISGDDYQKLVVYD